MTTRLRAMSPKRLAAYVDTHGHRPMSTFTRRRPKLATQAAVDTGPDAATVQLVLARDLHACVRCGADLFGLRGVGWSIQHRRARGMGGTDRPDTNQPQNLLAVCGSGTTGCHGWMEGHPIGAEVAGWRVRQSDDPRRMPVDHARYGRVFLTPNGSIRTRTPSRSPLTPRSTR